MTYAIAQKQDTSSIEMCQIRVAVLVTGVGVCMSQLLNCNHLIYQPPTFTCVPPMLWPCRLFYCSNCSASRDCQWCSRLRVCRHVSQCCPSLDNQDTCCSQSPFTQLPACMSSVCTAGVCVCGLCMYRATTLLLLKSRLGPSIPLCSVVPYMFGTWNDHTILCMSFTTLTVCTSRIIDQGSSYTRG